MITRLEEIKSYMDKIEDLISDDEGLLNREDMIKKEDVIVVLTEANYVKRMPILNSKVQRRGGRGVNAANFKEGDKAKILVCSYPRHDIVFFYKRKGIFNQSF